MNQAIKQFLLRHGGYGLGTTLYTRIQKQRLAHRVRGFLAGRDLPLPETLVIEPTLRCNQRCRMCYQDREKLAGIAERTSAEWIGFLKQNPQVRKVTLIGGEPMVWPGIYELIDYIDRHHDLVLCTNGTCFDDAGYRRIAACHRVISVSVSLDAPDERHDAIRGLSGAFAKVTTTIRRLAPHVPVSVNAVVTPHNMDLLPQLVDLVADLGGRKVKLEMERLYHDGVCDETTRQLAISAEATPHQASATTRDYTAAAISRAIEAAIQRGRHRGVYVGAAPNEFRTHTAACLDGRSRFLVRRPDCFMFNGATVSADGKLIHCFNIREAFGNVFEQPLEALWNAEPFRNFRQRLLDGGMCGLCEGCPFLSLRV